MVVFQPAAPLTHAKRVDCIFRKLNSAGHR
jgi:hypothetical protein